MSKTDPASGVPFTDFPTWDQIDGVLGVYLIHLERPLAHARHYVGYADDIVRRFQEHLDCNGSRMLCAAVNKEIPFEIVRVWPGQGRSFERRLKISKAGPRYCPICIVEWRKRHRERMRRVRVYKGAVPARENRLIFG